jgi:hypothetical protein
MECNGIEDKGSLRYLDSVTLHRGYSLAAMAYNIKRGVVVRAEMLMFAG